MAFALYDGGLTVEWQMLHTGDEGLRVCVHRAARGTPEHDALSLLALAAVAARPR
ncbi:hypothetical protein [Pseudonocardia nigra]|uniref:hypothetical protein n=1 Tax=Pseudonocardia nigra TaxID=1921578 RepID=UPI001C5F9C4C|nr:hypothetical protein [Pseudonocardia nigra]